MKRKMPKVNITQNEINMVCVEVGKQGEDISISKVKKLLGKGSHSEIAEKVLLFKENKNKALEIAEADKNNSMDIKNKSHPDEHQASAIIKNTLIKYYNENIDACSLDIREQIDKYINEQSSIDQLNTCNQKHQNTILNEHLELHLEHLEQQNKALLTKNQKLQSQISMLNHEKNALIANDKIKGQGSGQYSADANLEEPILEQIKQLKGDRRAAFSEQKICIYLYTTDFSTTLIKELKKGKKGKHQAVTKFNYKTKLWELSDFTLTTVQFLFTNGFDISEHLIQYATKLKRRNNL